MSTIDERIEKHELLAEKARVKIVLENDIIDAAKYVLNYHENAIENLKKKKEKAKPKQIVTEIKEQGVVITDTPKPVVGPIMACDPEDSKPEHKDVN